MVLRDHAYEVTEGLLITVLGASGTLSRSTRARGWHSTTPESMDHRWLPATVQPGLPCRIPGGTHAPAPKGSVPPPLTPPRMMRSNNAPKGNTSAKSSRKIWRATCARTRPRVWDANSVSTTSSNSKRHKVTAAPCAPRSCHGRSIKRTPAVECWRPRPVRGPRSIQRAAVVSNAAAVPEELFHSKLSPAPRFRASALHGSHRYCYEVPINLLQVLESAAGGIRLAV